MIKGSAKTVVIKYYSVSLVAYSFLERFSTILILVSFYMFALINGWIQLCIIILRRTIVSTQWNNLNSHLVNETFSAWLTAGLKSHILPRNLPCGRINFEPLCLHSIIYPEILAKGLQIENESCSIYYQRQKGNKKFKAIKGHRNASDPFLFILNTRILKEALGSVRNIIWRYLANVLALGSQ